MANSAIKTSGNTGLLYVELDTTGQINLRNAFGSGDIGSFKLQFKPGGAAPGSVVIKKRLHGGDALGLPWLTCLYYNEATTTVPNAGDAISTSMEVTVVADQDDVQLDYTSGVDGMVVAIRAVNG